MKDVPVELEYNGKPQHRTRKDARLTVRAPKIHVVNPQAPSTTFTVPPNDYRRFHFSRARSHNSGLYGARALKLKSDAKITAVMSHNNTIHLDATSASTPAPVNINHELLRLYPNVVQFHDLVNNPQPELHEPAEYTTGQLIAKSDESHANHQEELNDPSVVFGKKK